MQPRIGGERGRRQPQVEQLRQHADRGELADRAHDLGGTARVGAVDRRDALRDGLARVAPVGRRADLGSHRDVGRDVAGGPAIPAADRSAAVARVVVLRHLLQIVLEHAAGQCIHLVEVVAPLGCCQQALADHFATGVAEVRSQRIHHRLRSQRRKRRWLEHQ